MIDRYTSILVDQPFCGCYQFKGVVVVVVVVVLLLLCLVVFFWCFLEFL